jgi:pre-mRNA-splicing factor SYF2/beta-D-xylosidase 4
MRFSVAFLALPLAAAQLFCSQSPQSAWPFCDATLGLDARAADIVSRLSLADKISATVSSSPALPSVGLPAYQWW